MKITRRSVIGLAGFALAVFAAASLGGYFTSASVGSWYQQLNKPSFNPPGWVFGPVWTVLYILIAIAGWLVWNRHGFSGAPVALWLYFTQLALNAAWSFFFFYAQNPGAAFIELVVLNVFIILTVTMFFKKHKTAALIMLPYLAWTLFAAVLNLSLWQLN